VALATITIAVLVTAACTESGRPRSARSTGFDPFAASSFAAPRPAAAPASLAIGDCFDTDTFAPGDAIDRGAIHVVACANPHEHEVYALVAPPQGGARSYPGDAAMRSFGDDQCLAAFTAKLGNYRRSTLDFGVIAPDRSSWDHGDRTVICAVHDADFTQLSGSVLSAMSSLAPEAR
jgi:hypothetical protein